MSRHDGRGPETGPAGTGGITVLSDRAVTVAGEADRGRGTFLVAPADLSDALGWALQPAGLCQGETCVPVPDPDALRVGERIDLMAAAAALHRPSVADLDAGILAVALAADARRRALADGDAPDFVLGDLDDAPHALSDWAGRKRLLVAFASWCGCRYDLPGWQALADELGETGFTVIAVALDQRPSDVRPFTDGLTLPVLYDPHHLLTELYAISNVPTVVWIDEEGRIVRPNTEAFGTDTFAEFTGARSGPHLDLVRRWVATGQVPDEGDGDQGATADLSRDEVLARLHFRIAAEARRRGDDATTRRHVRAAGDLAPDDLTVWRAGLPLLGEDPFGPAFLGRFEEWRERGSPAHSRPAPSGPAPSG